MQTTNIIPYNKVVRDKNGLFLCKLLGKIVTETTLAILKRLLNAVYLSLRE